MKYRAVITWEGVVEADDELHAKTQAFEMLDEGVHGIFAVEVEPLLREVGDE